MTPAFVAAMLNVGELDSAEFAAEFSKMLKL
jgi:hypothetical protein